jgi:hypothetical protein
MRSQSYLNMCLCVYVCPNFNFWTHWWGLIKLLCHRRPLRPLIFLNFLQSVISACGTDCIFPVFTYMVVLRRLICYTGYIGIIWQHRNDKLGVHRAADRARTKTIMYRKYKINSVIFRPQFFSFLTLWIFKLKCRHSFVRTLYNDKPIHFNMIPHLARYKIRYNGFVVRLLDNFKQSRVKWCKNLLITWT